MAETAVILIISVGSNGDKKKRLLLLLLLQNWQKLVKFVSFNRSPLILSPAIY